MNDWIDVAALAKVVVISLLVGAGLPAIFAVGVRALAPVEGAKAGTKGGASRPALRVTAAVVCFAVCLAAVVLGVYRLVATGGH